MGYNGVSESMNVIFGVLGGKQGGVVGAGDWGFWESCVSIITSLLNFGVVLRTDLLV